MTVHGKYPERKSIRLRGYDYSQNGAYFVTICTQNRRYLFGEINNGEMLLNEAGIMVQDTWNGLPEYAVGYTVEALQVMPNHLHGILMIMDDTSRQLRRAHPAKTLDAPSHGPIRRSAPTTSMPRPLTEILQRFKRFTTHEYIRGVHELGWPPFEGKLWQRGYYERIVRNEREFFAYWEYIANNPLQWQYDEMNRGVR